MSDIFRNESKKDWKRNEIITPLNDDLKVGCLQRIADACELMVEDRKNLLRDLDYLKKENKRLELSTNRYWRAICAYKGIIKKYNIRRRTRINPNP